MRLTEVGAPVTSSDRDDRDLCNDDSGADGRGDFLGGLDAETDVTGRVTNENDGLESGTLTGACLLLDGLDLEVASISGIVIIHSSRGCVRPYLHDLVLECGQEKVNDLVLLDGQRVQVDLLHGSDLAGLDETAELGHRLPFLLLALVASATSSSTATAASTGIAPSTKSSSCASRGSACSASGCSSVSHVVVFSRCNDR